MYVNYSQCLNPDIVHCRDDVTDEANTALLLLERGKGVPCYPFLLCLWCDARNCGLNP